MGGNVNSCNHVHTVLMFTSVVKTKLEIKSSVLMFSRKFVFVASFGKSALFCLLSKPSVLYEFQLDIAFKRV